MTAAKQRMFGWVLALASAAVLAGSAGYWLGQRGSSSELAAATGTGENGRKILYWYDPMFPAQKFDKPGPSPFMDMQLVPKYADNAGLTGTPVVQVDPRVTQALGMRVAEARRGTLQRALEVPATVERNDRDRAVVAARADGFVVRSSGRAPGDVVRANAPIADIQYPAWGAAATELLAVRQLRDPSLLAAARQRLRLLGMGADEIAALERSGRASGIVTLRAPIGGVIETLEARPGASFGMGQSLVTINGLNPVWLHAAVPEAQAGALRLNQPAMVRLPAFPEQSLSGRVIAILPTADAASRTVTARIALANPGGRIRPGMLARVSLAATPRDALLVPSEVVIRTGRRTLVMLALPEGRFQPAEVRIGAEDGSQTEIVAGLSAGEKVVASGQFLLDSEASLTGVPVRGLDEAGK